MTVVDVVSAVSGAKSGKKGGKSGKTRNRQSDGREQFKHEGRFESVPDIDFGKFKCPSDKEFVDVLHYQQTRAAYLRHELSVVDAKVAEMSAQTYEVRNAAALRQREAVVAKAAANKVQSAVATGVLSIADVEKMLEQMRADAAAKALQS